jgi:hypothetical protein
METAQSMAKVINRAVKLELRRRENHGRRWRVVTILELLRVSEFRFIAPPH